LAEARTKKPGKPGFDLRTEFTRAQLCALFGGFVGLFLLWCLGCRRFIGAFFNIFSFRHGDMFEAVSSALFQQKATLMCSWFSSLQLLLPKHQNHLI
jgi:hypothetical protein